MIIIKYNNLIKFFDIIFYNLNYHRSFHWISIVKNKFCGYEMVVQLQKKICDEKHSTSGSKIKNWNEVQRFSNVSILYIQK